MKKAHSYSEKEFLKGVKFLSRKFPDFKKLTKDFPLRFEPTIQRAPYLSLIRSIAYQQIQIKAAESILLKFYQLYPHTKYPTPEEILNTPDEILRTAGFSQRKVKGIKDIAQKTIEGIVPTLEEVHHLTNEELIERLVVIYGIGKWSVEMLLIFQLGRLDVWPVDDFGTRRGWMIWQKNRAMPSIDKIQKEGEKYRPYRSILALYLWQVSNSSS